MSTPLATKIDREAACAALRKTLFRLPGMRYSLILAFAVGLPLLAIGITMLIYNPQYEAMPLLQSPPKHFLLAGILAMLTSGVVAHLAQYRLRCRRCRRRYCMTLFCADCGLADPAELLDKYTTKESDNKSLSEKPTEIDDPLPSASWFKPQPSSATVRAHRLVHLSTSVMGMGYAIMFMCSSYAALWETATWFSVALILGMIMAYGGCIVVIFTAWGMKCRGCRAKGGYTTFCTACGLQDPQEPQEISAAVVNEKGEIDSAYTDAASLVDGARGG